MKKEETQEIETITLEKPFILRAWLKGEANEIRKLKEETKEAQRNGGHAYSLQSKLHYKRQSYRHHHIACCELFGRTRDQIETPHENNLPNEDAIQSAKVRYAWTPEAITAYEEKHEKAICDN